MSLTQQILDAAAKGPAELGEADRLALLQACQKLGDVLENPVERFIRQFWAIYEPVAIRIAVDLNLIDIALAHDAPITAAELATKSNADETLIHRILNMLVSLSIFTSSSTSSNTSTTTYTPTPLGRTLATGSPLREAVIHISYIYPSVAALPSWFASTGYANPSDALDAPFNAAYDCKGTTYFEHMQQPGMERYAHAFNVAMAMNKTGEEATFVASYPATEKLRIEDPERVLFVDVGGSLGHQTKKFAEAYPELTGKLVVEDLADVVGSATDLPEKITKVAHDFFEPQPEAVKNAKAYYLRYILHDWPEKQAKVILQNIVDVMADDSVVLINDMVLPEHGLAPFEVKMDWHMMQLGSLERTEKQWRSLAESCGLEVKNIWWEKESVGRRGLIECVKKA